MRKALTLGAAFAVVAFAPLSGAAQMKQLDFSNKPELLKTNFQHIRPEGAQTTFFEQPDGLRFWLEPNVKKPERQGLYSKFTISGDFEITVNYEWNTTTVPTAGYGVSCGISVEFEDKNRMAALARGFQIGTGDAYLRTTKVPGNKDYDAKPFATEAKKGRLVMRRAKADLIFLAADGDDTLQELETIKSFTTASVRKLILFADAGGEPNALDARLTEIQVRAQEKGGDIPEAERGSNLWWWLTGGFLIGGAVAGYVGYRRWQDDKWLWARAKEPRTK